MPKHYIAGSGSYGCLYDNSQVFIIHRDAVQYLADLFELTKSKKNELGRNSYINLGKDAGADYAEINECECSDESVHQD